MRKNTKARLASVTALILLLTGCGDYSGKPVAASAVNDPAPSAPTPASMEAHFREQVQPRLGFCRTCHVPSGQADREDGRRFMLSSSPAADLANLRASWEQLGRNNPTSRILLMASGQESHTGGSPWPVGSPSYQAMDLLLSCFADPEACSALPGDTGSNPGSERPLLGSSRGGWPLHDFCQLKSDDTPLPIDPRALVQPGVNAGKAVYFNTFWKDCHVDPARVGGRPHAKTCGELRAAVARGERLLKGNGEVGAGVLFRGNDPAVSGSSSDAPVFPASAYNNLWQIWGMSARPDNFDELVAARYGTDFGAARNPYPLPGEDPNTSNGGSGRLPVWFSQVRTANGGWSGKIGVTCQGCHSAAVGSSKDGPGLGMLYGGGSGLHDYTLFLRDMAPLGYQASAAMLANLNRTRGTSNASAINLAFIFQEQYKLDASWFELMSAGSTASMDTPAWWNLGHRPLKFIDGIFPGDSARVDLVFYIPLAGLFGDKTAQAWASRHAQDANDWVMSLKAPKYPLAIDTALAEQGAVLFHSKNLWAAGLKNPLPKPAGGNGSCASCHGAYSPRFVHDPAYLDSPALEGIASYVVPKRIIGTDAERVDTNNEGVQEAGSRNFFGYPETAGTAQDCGMQNRADLRGTREPGYLAPPLYGVWATAPYLHNGSVPNLWEVLQPADRQPIWRRVSTPARSDQQGKVVMGFDTNLQRAFDPLKVGWKYEVLSCGGTGTTPYLDCLPGANAVVAPVQQLLSLIYGNLSGTWNVLHPPLLTTQQIEERKIYNTQMFSQGNQGHEFVSVLTDQERRALIEYMKTL
ncbi:MAG: hypothetical protein AABY68_01730 [Pseudomonadota bacterium]